jgi:hypothetical protein
VEVKGSTVVRGPVFRIHGLDQLAPPSEGGRLCFFALRLREDGAGEHSLPSLTRTCGTQFEAAADTLAIFETLLMHAGYFPFSRSRLHNPVADR